MTNFWFTFLVTFVAFQSVQSLCSSTAYSTQIRDILLTQTDYDVYEGYVKFLPEYSHPVGTNPSGIYAVTDFDNVNITDPYALYSNITYFQRASNALIFPLCTPPKSSYFSFVSYIINRFNSESNGSYIERETLFAALGYSLNHLLWNTSNPTVWDILSTFIQTADQETFEYFHNLLVSNDVNSQDINLQTIPQLYTNFLPYKYNANNVKSYNQTYDTGNLLMRVAIPENETLNNIYYNISQTIYMLQPKNLKGDKPRKHYQPFILNEYSPQNINETNMYESALNEYKNDLIHYMQTTHNLTYVNETEIGPWPPGAQPTACDVFYCCLGHRNCGGNNCDDLYNQINKGAMTGPESYVLVIGIMHSNPDIAQTTYSGIAYYDHTIRPFAPVPFINNKDYNGSGLILPVVTNVDKEYLKNIFVVQVAFEENCMVDDLPGICLDHTYAKDGYIYADVAIRNYLNPITKTAPISTQILPSILLRFRI